MACIPTQTNARRLPVYCFLFSGDYSRLDGVFAKPPKKNLLELLKRIFFTHPYAILVSNGVKAPKGCAQEMHAIKLGILFYTRE